MEDKRGEGEGEELSGQEKREDSHKKTPTPLLGPRTPKLRSQHTTPKGHLNPLAHCLLRGMGWGEIGLIWEN